MAGKKGLRNGASFKAQYKAYKSQDRWLKNKIARLEKTVRNQPTNEVAKAALEVAKKANCKYSRNRGSNGHPCKGLFNRLGFEKNHPSIGMLKSGIAIHHYYGTHLNLSPCPTPNTGLSIGDQLEAFGFTRPKRNNYARKHKKTS